MQEVGLEEYTLHKQLAAHDEILQKFYVNFKPAVANQLPYTIVRGEIFSFTREEIMEALLILEIQQEGTSFSERVNTMPIRSPAFRKLCANLSDFTFTTTYMVFKANIHVSTPLHKN